MVPGCPDRILPASEEAPRELEKCTLTNLYDQHPAWFGVGHRELDAAVAAACGWPDGLTDR